MLSRFSQSFHMQSFTFSWCRLDSTMTGSLFLILRLVSTNRIPRPNNGEELTWFGNQTLSSLFFVVDVVVLVSSSHDLQAFYWSV